MSSYKNLKELDITPHSYTYKKGSESLDLLTRELNDLVYSWQFVFLSKDAAEYLAGKVKGIREQLRGMSDTAKGSSHYERWLEAGNLTTNWINKLKAYNEEVSQDFQTDRKVLQRLVAEWIKVNRNEIPVSQLVTLAERNKVYSQLYNFNIVPSFTKMQNEILAEINERLKL